MNLDVMWLEQLALTAYKPCYPFPTCLIVRAQIVAVLLTVFETVDLDLHGLVRIRVVLRLRHTRT